MVSNAIKKVSIRFDELKFCSRKKIFSSLKYSDIVNCLQNTIDLYEALARQDFDFLFEKEPVLTVTSSKKLDDARPAVVESLKSTAPVPETSTSVSFKMISPVKTPAPFSFSIPSTGFGTVSKNDRHDNSKTFRTIIFRLVNIFQWEIND